MKIVVRTRQHMANESEALDFRDILLLAAQALRQDEDFDESAEPESKDACSCKDKLDPIDSALAREDETRIRKSRLEEINRVYKTCKTAYELYASSRDTLETLLAFYHDDYGALDPEGVLSLLDKELKDVCL